MQRDELISYAMDFASYLVRNVEGINRIILHGSVPRGDFGGDSDVDLFIEADEKKEKKIFSAKEKYLKTENYKKWGLKGVKNEFSIIVGKLDDSEWKNLKRAIVNTGVLLYGKFRANVEKNYSYVMFSFENIKPDSKRITINRKLFGFMANGEKYTGMIEKLGGIKVGKSVVLLPAENGGAVKNYFREKKVALKIYDIWSDTKIPV